MTKQQGAPEAPRVRTADYEAGWKDGYKQGAWAAQQPTQAAPALAENGHLTQAGHDLLMEASLAGATLVSKGRLVGDTAQAAESAPVLPDFDTVEEHIYGACRRYITRDMLEPILNLIRDAIYTDRAARAPTWQPIATAPKDGKAILLRSKNGRIADGLWSDANSRTGFWAWAYVHQEPAEWMPKPGSPAARAQEQQP